MNVWRQFAENFQITLNDINAYFEENGYAQRSSNLNDFEPENHINFFIWIATKKNLATREFKNWLKENSILPAVKDEYFQIPADRPFFDSISHLEKWQPEFLPLASWDSFLVIASHWPITKKETLGLDRHKQRHCFVIADAELLVRHASNFGLISAKNGTSETSNSGVLTAAVEPSKSFVLPLSDKSESALAPETLATPIEKPAPIETTTPPEPTAAKVSGGSEDFFAQLQRQFAPEESEGRSDTDPTHQEGSETNEEPMMPEGLVFSSQDNINAPAESAATISPAGSESHAANPESIQLPDFAMPEPQSIPEPQILAAPEKTTQNEDEKIQIPEIPIPEASGANLSDKASITPSISGSHSTSVAISESASDEPPPPPKVRIGQDNSAVNIRSVDEGIPTANHNGNQVKLDFKPNSERPKSTPPPVPPPKIKNRTTPISPANSVLKELEAPPVTSFFSSINKQPAMGGAAKDVKSFDDILRGKTIPIAKIEPKHFDECKSIDEAGTQALVQMSNIFEVPMILLFRDGQLLPWKWSDLFLSIRGEKPDAIDLNSPSMFRIVFRTAKPYHGYVVTSEANQKFFNEFYRGMLPKHATLVPIMIEGRMAGIVLGFTNGKIDYRQSLRLMERLAFDLGRTFTSIRTRMAKSA